VQGGEKRGREGGREGGRGRERERERERESKFRSNGGQYRSTTFSNHAVKMFQSNADSVKIRLRNLEASHPFGGHCWVSMLGLGLPNPVPLKRFGSRCLTNVWMHLSSSRKYLTLSSACRSNSILVGAGGGGCGG
jgi:hypothetical protein